MEQLYQTLLAEFDTMATAVTDGGTIDGVKVIATDSPEVKAMIVELQNNHHETGNGRSQADAGPSPVDHANRRDRSHDEPP